MNYTELPYETFEVKLCRIGNESDTVEIAVYDDDHDLRAFFSGSDSQGIRLAAETFHQVEPLEPPFSENSPNELSPYNFGLSSNPTRAEIIVAIDTAISALEGQGFEVKSKVNNWQ